ncbi:Hsp20/alpha crystallin family protein [Candidatus Woesebacteria bacterium]|nr:Hsp20/alpha crystallin family protein [Candidatus Woesebacteria bacterium]
MNTLTLSPLMRSMSRWPSIWDDDELFNVPSGSNNLDVYETENEVVVKANVAGIPADAVDVTFEKGVLWIKAEKAEESNDNKRKHYSKSTWNYSYRVAVPGLINYNVEPQADIEDGVITITFQKAEASKPKKLQVKTKVSK